MPTRRNAALWFPIVLLLVLQALTVLPASSPLRQGSLLGDDGYMRLVRVAALYQTAAAWGYVSDTFPQVVKVSEQFSKKIEEEVDAVNVLPQVAPVDSTEGGGE